MSIYQHDTGLKKETIDQILNVLNNYTELGKVLLYGSRAKGNYRNGSDIDLCFMGKNLNTKILFKVENELDDLLLPYSFDLTIYEHIDNSNFKEHINRVGIEFS